LAHSTIAKPQIFQVRQSANCHYANFHEKSANRQLQSVYHKKYWVCKSQIRMSAADGGWPEKTILLT
jgi:hypothetical protein